ncbi:hypothetical protein FJ651_14285 [Paucihalobacter ruber]|uniref:Uncharacterized protein n=1 Tax=Paucihalobacter ruber TaxID=2567861 RepID=A0A506PEQ7_9FLAO|nr:hypothetical protein [Paucihalobacter ruber]TPV31978.1 hypothetical protein FJ651_14285 [Paucihalobacter ruber]
MAPNKIDHQFKSQLESRNSQPSNHAWEKLSAQLDSHQKNKKRVFLQWLSVAALLIIALSVGGAFIFKSSQALETPIIVDLPTDNIKPSKEINKSSIIENTESGLAEILSEQDKTNVITSEEKQPIPTKIKTTQIAENKETSIELSQSFEDKKVTEVVAAIAEIQNQNNKVTEQEIELLLKEAQRDILLNNIYNEQTKKVDATALLAQVEGELNQSFRDKVFEALKSGFITVKTAVADRKN